MGSTATTTVSISSCFYNWGRWSMKTECKNFRAPEHKLYTECNKASLCHNHPQYQKLPRGIGPQPGCWSSTDLYRYIQVCER
ncbi:hypothetical protein FVEN_g13195 [Fusarium venenatum]|nr:hypothetical protein FVEN_g13195 [Fusarium venenatum]